MAEYASVLNFSGASHLCLSEQPAVKGFSIIDQTHVISANIVPWAESHDDRPTNGPALGRICHWAIDKFLMGMAKSYEVLTRLDKSIN